MQLFDSTDDMSISVFRSKAGVSICRSGEKIEIDNGHLAEVVQILQTVIEEQETERRRAIEQERLEAWK